MKILIFGITGMLGHAFWLNLRDKHETFGTIHGSVQELSKKSSFFKKRQDAIIETIDVLQDEDIEKAFEVADPDVIVNCVGLIKQLKDAKFPIPTTLVEAKFTP